MPHDVFISYSSDDKPAADAVCARLEDKGIRCWIAPRDILAGRDWAASIIDAINFSQIMVLLVTGKSNVSPQVVREVSHAVNKGRVIIPVRLQDIPLSKNLEYYLGPPHWLDAITPPLEVHLDRLADTVNSFLTQQSPEDASSDGKVESPPSSAKDDRTIRVANAAELLKAIGPNRVIELEPGEYNLSQLERRAEAYYRWEAVLDIDGRRQFGLFINNVPNLTMRIHGSGVAHVFINEPYAYVLTFRNADGLSLSGLRLGHFPSQGYCIGGVLGLADARNVTIANSVLYGSGTEGITLKNVKRFRFVDSCIADCTYGIMQAEDCDILSFEQSTFENNREFYGFEFGYSLRISFTNCVVKNNRIEESLFRTSFESTNPHGQAIAFVGGRIEGNVARGLSDEDGVVVLKDVKLSNNRWKNNPK